MRFGGVAAYVSGVVAAVGVVFLIAMFVSFGVGSELAGAFGRVNDVLIAVQYSLALPAAVALHALLRPRNKRLSPLVLLIGIIGLLAVVVLQVLLVFGVLTFERQVVYVVLALLVVGAWLVITGILARPILPHSERMSLLAVPYVGYPVWAFWLGTQLLSQPSPGVAPGPDQPSGREAT
jgi:hypothetical protein